jgi:hypothetical protein
MTLVTHPYHCTVIENVPGPTELLDLHWRSFSKPFERIESLCPLLRFRVLLGGGRSGEVRFDRASVG